MNREILFRGKRADNGEWVEGFYVCISGVCHYILTGNPVIDPNEISIENYKVIPSTVGQFTGLIDNNGRKIFEGDIIRLTFSGAVGEIICDIDYIVRFNLFGRVTDKSLTDYHCKDIEVVGNVHDNPELLKGE